jgi:hypothetical protein
MKKKFLLFSLSAVTLGATLMSDSSGPAQGSNNRTGVNGSTTNCGGGCHGGNSANTTATIRVDSTGGVAVTKYVAGMTYTVTVTGSHTTLTKYGFQFATVSGSGTSQVQAGTYGATLPSQVAKHVLSSISFIEQSSTITGPLSKSFTWTAPASSVGDIKMYLTVNAVNGNGSADGSDFSGNTSKTLTFYTPPTSVADVTGKISVNAFPNPVMNELNLQMGNAYSNYSVQVYDITGRNIMNTEIAASATGSATINTSNWIQGLYKVVVSNNNGSEVISVVKQ